MGATEATPALTGPSLLASPRAPAVLSLSLSTQASPAWDPHPAFVSKPDCPPPEWPPSSQSPPHTQIGPEGPSPQDLLLLGSSGLQSVVSPLRFNTGGPFGAQRNPTHPPGHDHGDGLDQALESHQLIEAEHLAGRHVQPVLGHDPCGQAHATPWGPGCPPSAPLLPDVLGQACP